MSALVSTTIVSVFADQPAARAAIDRLGGLGIPPGCIRLHDGLPTALNAASLELDEYVSGGFISNLSALLGGVMDHRVAEGSAATYADLVRSEGTLVSVQAQGLEEAQRYEALLRRVGTVRVSILPAEDTVSFHRLYPP